MEDLCCIYRIYCSANGKSYIGQTNDFRRRMREHFEALSSGRHINQHLQRAYSKYDHDTFWPEVLEENILAEFIGEREKWWITHFDAFRNGFNRTLGGEDQSHLGVSVLWNGVQYKSLAAAARALNISVQTMHTRVNKGYVSDGDMPGQGRRHHGNPVSWNNIQFESIRAAARTLGISVTAMHYRVHKGYTCDDDMMVQL